MIRDGCQHTFTERIQLLEHQPVLVTGFRSVQYVYSEVSNMAEWKIVNRGRYYICRDGKKFCEVETLEDAESILTSVKRDNGVK